MTCTICGNEGLLSESGYCSVCTEKLKAFSEASSTFRQAAQTVISVEVSKKSLEAGSACEKEVAGIGESRVIFRFGQSEKCTLRHPFSVAIGPGGDIMVLDQPERSEYRVTVFDPDGGYTRTVVTCSKGHGTNQMKYPKGIASDLRGNFYIPDAGTTASSDSTQMVPAWGRSAVWEKGRVSSIFPVTWWWMMRAHCTLRTRTTIVSRNSRHKGFPC